MGYVGAQQERTWPHSWTYHIAGCDELLGSHALVGSSEPHGGRKLLAESDFDDSRGVRGDVRSGRGEGHGDAVHAVSQAGRLRAVVEHVTEMTSAPAAGELQYASWSGWCRGALRLRCPGLSKSSANRCRSRTWYPTSKRVRRDDNRIRDARCSSLSGLLYGCSVPASRSTLYWAAVRAFATPRRCG